MQTRLTQCQQQVEQLSGQIHAAAQAQQQTKELRLRHASALAGSLNPYGVLSRGYAMARTDGGRLVTSVADVCKGDMLYMDMCDGTLVCTVQDIQKEETDNG